MKLLLTTIVDNVNYGTYLQAYATAHTVRLYGYDPVVLNYIRPFMTFRGMAASIGLAKACIYKPLDWILKTNLKRFLKGKVSMTRSFSDWSRRARKVKGYDLYLTGSDQVWNCVHNHSLDPVYIWKGITGKKVSFSASLGTDEVPEEFREELAAALSQYKVVTVRESSGVKALEDIGIKAAEQILDPTLIINQDEWGTLTNSNFKKKERYVLVYSVEKGMDSVAIETAHKVAEKRGLKIYMVTPYMKFHKPANVDRIFRMATVDLFLTLFKQADFAVVSSFHGTAFAINFGIQFLTVAPERFNSRVLSLLSILNLEDRYITGGNPDSVKEIDFLKVNSLLECERRKTHTILDKVFDNRR